MRPERLLLKEVVVKSKKGKYDDPAYDLMRKAIAKREFHKRQMEVFSCKSYIKGLQRLLNAPSKFMGFDVTLPGLDSTNSGIVYFSESVSEYHRMGPNREKEVMIASKVSGNNNGFSFNSASDFQISLYDEIIAPGQIGPRGMVSPLADQSFLYYRFEWLGTIKDQGISVHKIAIEPRRRIDPAFKGVIYLQDSTWRIHSVKIFADKSSNLEFIDSLTISQIYAPVNDTVWMVRNMRYDFQFKILAFKGNGYFMGSFDEYKLFPQRPKNFFNNEILSISEEVKSKDSLFWKSIRPMTLTDEENKDYYTKDSLSAIWETKTYKDSIDHIRNRFKPIQIVTGYTYRNTYKGYNIAYESPLNSIQFNTMEGWLGEVGLNYTKRKRSTGKGFEIGGRFRYGEASNQAYSTASFSRFWGGKKRTVWKISGGRYVQQFDVQDPINPVVNTIYTIFSKQNLLKLYDKTFFKTSLRSELYNGLSLEAQITVEERNNLMNNSAYHIGDRFEREWSPNLTLELGKHTAATFSFNGSWQPAQKYITLPDRKINLGSDYPTFFFNYRKGLGGLESLATAFDFISLAVNDEVNLGMAGDMDYIITGGGFLRHVQSDLPDRRIFSGNETFVLRTDPAAFQLLPYYAFTGIGSYVQAHVKYNPGGLLLNKIPGLRKLKLRESLGVRALYQEGMPDPYLEYYAGIKNIFKILAIEYHRSAAGGLAPIQGFRIGLSI